MRLRSDDPPGTPAPSVAKAENGVSERSDMPPHTEPVTRLFRRHNIVERRVAPIDTKVSTDTIVQWIRLRASGVIASNPTGETNARRDL
jgi:hypothetical protein